MGPRPLPHHPGALAELAAENVEGTVCLGRLLQTLELSLRQGSEPRPPKPTCCPAPGLPLYWPGAASRAETGRGAADPLGELTCTSLFRAREEKLTGGRVGEGPLPTVCHQRPRSMALNTHDSRGKDTRVSPSVPPGQESHTVDIHIIRSTLPHPAAASSQNSEAQSNNDRAQ